MPTGYLSTDIETTGLDPESNQILQVSMVWDDLVTPIEELKHLTFYIDNGDHIVGNLFALNLNQPILKAILDSRNQKPTKYAVLKHRAAEIAMVSFLDELREETKQKSLFVAGKNAAGFDLPFLKVHFPVVSSYFKHRVLDPGSMYAWLDEDTPVPDLNRINKFIGNSEVSHDALDDARDVIKAIRYLYGSRIGAKK